MATAWVISSADALEGAASFRDGSNCVRVREKAVAPGRPENNRNYIHLGRKICHHLAGALTELAHFQSCG